MTTLHCPYCGRELSVATDLVGKPIRCPSCMQLLPTDAEEAAQSRLGPATNPAPEPELDD